MCPKVDSPGDFGFVLLVLLISLWHPPAMLNRIPRHSKFSLRLLFFSFICLFFTVFGHQVTHLESSTHTLIILLLSSSNFTEQHICFLL